MATIISQGGGNFGGAGGGGPWDDENAGSSAVSKEFETDSQPANGGDVSPTKDNLGRVSVSNNVPNVRRYNPLGEFASYTYQLSLYVMTPDAYDRFIESGRQDIQILNNLNTPCVGGGAYLIAQSGGINDSISSRAKGFEFDYYMDNLKMIGAFNPQDTGSSTFAYEMSFTITEAYGFSFITNLKRAQDAIAKYSTTRNIKNSIVGPTRQFFILGIKFLGYDKDGNLVQPYESGIITNPVQTLGGVVDRTYGRYYDIYFTELKFKIDGRAVQYQIKAAPVSIAEGAGAKRGLIDKGAQNLTGTTVEQVLNSLATKLNNDQNGYKEKIKYSFEFYGQGSDAIKNATIISPADVAKAKWPMSKLKNQASSNPATEAKTTPISTERIISFERTVPIVQAVSQIVTQSTYLTDALKSVYKSTNEPDAKTDNYGAVEIQSEATIRWINISPKLSNPRWDTERNDFVFDITYYITPYDTPMIINPQLVDKMAPYKGPFKRYDYWYTGKNSEIIKYELTLNNSFYNTVLDPNYSLNRPSPVPNAGDKRTPVVRTGETGVGLEAQNSYITSLYDPGGYADAEIEILGDPDLLAWPSVAGDLKKYDSGQLNSAYAMDGVTMNPMSGQVFIEIDFKEAVDYNNTTGVMDINESIMFWKYPPEIAAKIKGISYMIKTITSYFRNGKFTQVLNLTLNTAYESYAKTSDERQQDESYNNTELARLANQGNVSKPTGFTPETPAKNSAPGGDPCVMVPENKIENTNKAEDDANYQTSVPVDYGSNLSDVRGA